MPTTFNYMRRSIPLNQATKWKLRGDSQTVLGKSGDVWGCAC